MGWRTVADVRDHSAAARATYTVAVMLAERAPDETRIARPGLACLAKDARCDRSTVQRALKWLIAEGEITPVAHEKGGRGMATEYYIRVGTKEWQDATLCETPERVASEARKGGADATPTEEEPNRSLVEDQRSSTNSHVEFVFAEWLESTGKTSRTQLSEARRKLIAAALNGSPQHGDGYPVEDLVDAVRGWRWSKHHRGDNDRGRSFNDIELLLRDCSRIEFFRDLEREHGAAGDVGWAVPDLPGEDPTMVAVAAGQVRRTGQPVTAETVLERLRRTGRSQTAKAA